MWYYGLGDNMAYMAVRWKIKELLESNELSVYAFWQESGLAKGTAYRLVNGETDTINTQTLDATMKALRALTGKHLEIADLLEYVE